jgi:hypothetical protein
MGTLQKGNVEFHTGNQECSQIIETISMLEKITKNRQELLKLAKSATHQNRLSSNCERLRLMGHGVMPSVVNTSS